MVDLVDSESVKVFTVIPRYLSSKNTEASKMSGSLLKA